MHLGYFRIYIKFDEKYVSLDKQIGVGHSYLWLRWCMIGNEDYFEMNNKWEKPKLPLFFNATHTAYSTSSSIRFWQKRVNVLKYNPFLINKHDYSSLKSEKCSHISYIDAIIWYFYNISTNHQYIVNEKWFRGKRVSRCIFRIIRTIHEKILTCIDSSSHRWLPLNISSCPRLHRSSLSSTKIPTLTSSLWKKYTETQVRRNSHSWKALPQPFLVAFMEFQKNIVSLVTFLKIFNLLATLKARLVSDFE